MEGMNWGDYKRSEDTSHSDFALMQECKSIRGIFVNGYRKKDGTWVDAYCRRK